MQNELPAPAKRKPAFPFAALLSDIQREWDVAEEELKRCEQVSLKASVPAINELRYAGRRIVDALNCDAKEASEDAIKALLDDARFNCHRARHDAIDAALDVIGIDLELMTKKLGYAAVLKAYPEFTKLYADFAQARAKIANSRGDRENRTKIYDTIASVDFHSIADRYAALKTCQPIALAFAAKANAQRIAWWFMLVLTLTSLTFAILSYRNALEMRRIQEANSGHPTADGDANSQATVASEIREP